MTARLVLMLPEHPARADARTFWWSIDDDALSQGGDNDDWRKEIDAHTMVVGIAPAADTRITLVDAADVADAQAATRTRLEAAGASLGGLSDTHSVIGNVDIGGDRRAIALADKAVMQAWIDWANALDTPLHHILPAGALLPMTGDWHQASIGGVTLVGRDGLAVDEADGLIDVLTAGAFVDTLPQDRLDKAILREAQSPSVDLRTGAFAYKRGWQLDPGRLREFAILAAIIAFLALAVPLAKIMRWNAAADDQRAIAVAVATDALGRPVDYEMAESALRAGGAARTGLSSPLDAVLALQLADPALGLVSAGYDESGSVSLTLTGDAMRLEAAVRSLQRDGWQVSSTPAGDGALNLQVFP